MFQSTCKIDDESQNGFYAKTKQKRTMSDSVFVNQSDFQCICSCCFGLKNNFSDSVQREMLNRWKSQCSATNYEINV